MLMLTMDDLWALNCDGGKWADVRPYYGSKMGERWGRDREEESIGQQPDEVNNRWNMESRHF